MMKRALLFCLIGLLSACNMGVPGIVTPTVAPTINTPTPSQLPTLIAQVASPTLTLTETPRPTFTGSPTFTPLPSDTPPPTLTPIPTDTIPPSPTPLPAIGVSPTPSTAPTFMPSNTAVVLPSLTPTDYVLPSVTPLPSLTPTPLFLPTLTPIPSWTPRPTFTLTVPPLPTFTLTNANITEAFAPIGVRTSTPEPTLPPATLDVTPTFITALPGATVTIPPTLPPIPADPNAGSSAATPTNLPALPTPLPNLVVIAPPPDLTSRTFALNTSGEALNFALAASSTFAQNPVDPNVFVRVDPSGNLHLISDYAAGRESPINFSPFDFTTSDPVTNKARARRVVWSRDGTRFAYLIDQWSDGDDQEPSFDGVWIAAGDLSWNNQVFRDCHREAGGCLVSDFRGGPFRYRTVDLAWGQGDALLIRLFLFDENRFGFTLVSSTMNPQYPPPVYRYDYASWSWDGTRLLVSGYNPDGSVALRWFDPATGLAGNPLLNASALGMYVSYAVQRPTGQIVALASTGGAAHLIDVSGAALSGDIGTVAPERVEWSPDRSAVLVITYENEQRRYYLVAVTNGAITDITDRVSAGAAVEWINQAP